MNASRSLSTTSLGVPTATVVIMNPTHFAVALRIRAVAEENDVPVVENPPLARALYAAVEIDEPVPPEHFKAVAQVIGYVFKLQGKIPARAP